MAQIDVLGGKNNEIHVKFPKPKFLRAENHFSEFASPYELYLARKNLGIRDEVDGGDIKKESITEDKLSPELKFLLSKIKEKLVDDGYLD